MTPETRAARHGSPGGDLQQIAMRPWAARQACGCRALAAGRPPHYDYEGRIEHTLRLIAAAGFRVEVINIIDRMSVRGVLPSLMPLYEELAR